MTGLLRRTWGTALEMRGGDRARFLQSYLTCDLGHLAEGHGAYGFLTSVKGRVLADVRVLAFADRLWLEVPAGSEEEVAGHLRRYVILERVEIAPLAGWTPWTRVGGGPSEVFGALPEAPHRHVRSTIQGREVVIARDPDLGSVPQWTLWAQEGVDLIEALGDPALEPEVYERWRVEAGRPRFGRDFGPDCFPQETGLEDEAVSYTKGCYLGQEVVARIHYRGGIQRTLRGLIFDPETAEVVGRSILHDGREAGTVTSAAVSPRLGPIGLAIVHLRVEPGSGVELEGGGKAEVVELPFPD